jgi:tRNA modification GTPase
VAAADLALVLVDARAAGEGIPAHAAAILGALPAALPRLVVHNKIDLAAASAPRVERRDESVAGEARARRHVFLSAKTGAGVDGLRQEMLAMAGAHEDMEGTFLARARHLDAMRGAERQLAVAAQHIAADPPPLELFAEELRQAQAALAAITGEFTADDLLGVIFSRFCIGK